MMTKKTKKAEITSQQIVLLIVLIVSFAVILFFIFRLNLGKTSDAEVCHNSVVTRGSGVIPKESIPLNCKTSYICITKDGSCEKMSGSYETKKVSTANDVYDVLANQMADCWWMFGEGKLNYVGQTFNSDLYCSICSQVVFDNSLTMFQNGQIDKKDFYDYLSSAKMPDQNVSYLDYLLGLKSSKALADTLKADNSDFGKINLDKQHYIVMGIFSEVGVAKWILIGAGAGVGIAAITIITGGVGTIPALILVTSGVVGGGAGGYFIGTTVKGDSGHDYLSPTIIEASSADFDKLQCASIKTLA